MSGLASPGGGNKKHLKALLLQRNDSRKHNVTWARDAFSLTPRESDVTSLIVLGLTNKEISQKLRVSPNTVKTFLRMVMLKMSVSTRSGVVGTIMNLTGNHPIVAGRRPPSRTSLSG